jgi:putative transposase
MCKMFKLSKSSYYDWLGRKPSKRWSENQTISSVIHDIFKDSFESYGAPRIKAELSKKGYNVSRPRVARIMRANNLFARRKRRFKVTTDSEHNYPLARNILNQNFTVFRKNQVWVSDITYIETKQGWMYLTVIIDLFHRKLVGWSMGETLNTSDTIISAWNMAVKSNDITKRTHISFR